MNMIRKALNLMLVKATIWLTYHSPHSFQQQPHYD